MTTNEEWNKGFIAGLKYARSETLVLEQKLDDYIKGKESRLE